MEQFSKTLIENFKGLLFLLKKTNIEFEEVADEVTHAPLKEALNGLSTETNNFENEIKLQLHHLGVAIEDNQNLLRDHIIENNSVENPGEELVGLFTQFEQFLLKYYNNLLVENIPCKILSKTIAYQMDMIKLTFMKLNMLNNSRFNNLKFI
jgi:hypothetical protein